MANVGNSSMDKASHWDEPPPPYDHILSLGQTEVKFTPIMKFSAESHLPANFASTGSGPNSNSESQSHVPPPPPHSYFNVDFAVTDTSYSNSAIQAHIERQNEIQSESHGQGQSEAPGKFVSPLSVRTAYSFVFIIGLFVIIGIITFFILNFGLK